MSIEEPTALDLLKQRADTMGITYHPSIGEEKLKAKINEKLEASGAAKIDETEAARKMRLRKEANKLIRVRLTCMNPAKKDWPGEIISAGNSYIGRIKKMIPFNAPDGWHVPSILLEVLKERKFQSFYTVDLPNGQKAKRSRLNNEFAIEYLPPLEIEELKTLAAKQASEAADK